ncbi:MAG: PspA/IM30 family protein, partial [Cyanobacteriota bacterium]
MGFFDRLSRLLRANLNDLVSKAEDPAKILDQSVADMQADLVKLRQAVATALAVSAIGAGGSHSCGVTSAGALACGGRYSSGQLGDPTTTMRATPT